MGYGQGSEPMEYQTVIGLLSDTGHPWISTNVQDSILDVRPSLVHQQNAIKMAFRWRANDDPLLMVF